MDTDQTTSAEELRWSEAQFRVLAEVADEYAVFMLDTDGRVATWNVGAEKLTGYRAEEAVGRRRSIFYPPEDAEARRSERVLEAARCEGQWQGEAWWQRRSGARFWARITLTAMRDDEGQLSGFAEVIRDLTDRRGRDEELREYQAELRTREEQYRTALKNSPVVFARVDEELRYEWILNPHPDFDAEAVVGKRDDELDAGPGIEALVELKRQVFERGRPQRRTITFLRSDGDRTYDITATPLWDAPGQVQA